MPKIVSDSYKKIRVSNPIHLKELFEQSNPTIASFDTETDGLFIKSMQPFLVVFGWKNTDELFTKGTVVSFEPTTQLVQTMYDLCSKVKTVYAHNAKFDMHVVHNFYKKYPHNNIVDTMTIARLVLESRPLDKGGPSLALKSLADKYIERSSSNDQKIIKQIKKKIQMARKKEFNDNVVTMGFDKKKYNIPNLERLQADPILSVEEETPPEINKLWEEFKTKYPATKTLKKAERVTYKHIYEYTPESKEAMIKYAFNDVVYTIELALKFMPYITAYKQTETLNRESKALYALYDSERIGIKIDTDYIEKSKTNMRNYIIEKRTALQKILGPDLIASKFANSPKQITDWLTSKQVQTHSTNKETLIELTKTEETPQEAKETIELILEIRSLVKKYSTDLLQFEANSLDGRRYSTFKQNSTVTGRLSGDMQQMPNEGIKDAKGNVLFEPRRAIIPSGNGFNMIAYLDYSQVELRIQAHYTWLAMNGKGDTNMLRMYVPFNCYATAKNNKIIWDPNNNTHTKQEFIGAYNWKQIEDNKPWAITDMHLLTAMKAFPHLQDLDPEDLEVKKYRKKAKPVNFGIQYGAGITKVIETIGSEEEGRKLFNGNREAFPGLPLYALWLKKQYNKTGYVENAYGRKYKFIRYSHKMNNYVIQGTGADLLKEKTSECYEYLKDKRTRLILNIHDELQFEIYDGEEYVIEELQKIMANTGHKFIVPLNVDIETTRTNWADKQDGIIKGGLHGKN